MGNCGKVHEECWSGWKNVGVVGETSSNGGSGKMDGNDGNEERLNNSCSRAPYEERDIHGGVRQCEQNPGSRNQSADK